MWPEMLEYELSATSLDLALSRKEYYPQPKTICARGTQGEPVPWSRPDLEKVARFREGCLISYGWLYTRRSTQTVRSSEFGVSLVKPRLPGFPDIISNK